MTLVPALALSLLLQAGNRPAPEDERPNVLIIMTDQFNRRVLGCMGNEVVKTPNIDRLAAEGALFRWGYCNAPVCGPSRYSMFTGLYPSETGVFENRIVPRDGLRYLPEYLRGAGFYTASVGKTHFTPPLRRHGFQELRLSAIHLPTWSHYFPWLESEIERRGMDVDPLFWKPSKGWEDRIEDLCPVNPFPDDMTAEAWITRNVLELIRSQRDAGRRFFVHASYLPPHHPYAPIQEYLDLYDPDEIPAPASFGRRTEASRDFTKEEWRRIWHHYYAYVSQLDHHVGELLAGLAELGVAENTLVFFLSDHGDMLGEFSMLFKDWAYEGSLGVPFIVRWPERFPGGKVIDAPVSLIDVLPTVLDAVGIPVPETLHGRTVLPLIEGDEDGDDRVVYAMDVRLPPFHVLACREQRLKLTVRGRRKGAHDYQLVDLLSDPDELVDLSTDPAHREDLDRLKAELEAFWEPQSKLVEFPLPKPLHQKPKVLPLLK